MLSRISTLALAMLAVTAMAGSPGKAKAWSIKADYIEACSCNLFCQCYFKTSPEGGEMCNFDNALVIRQGHVGNVDVSGKKVWLSGDLGGDWSQGQAKTAVITFEPGTTREQKDAIEFMVGKIYPVKWASFAEDESPIYWQRDGNNGTARLGDGTRGEVKLTGQLGPNGRPIDLPE